MSWEDAMIKLCVEDYERTQRRRKLKKLKNFAISLGLVIIGVIIGMVVFGG